MNHSTLTAEQLTALRACCRDASAFDEALRLVEEAIRHRDASASSPEPCIDDESKKFFHISVDLLAVCGFDGKMRRLNSAWEKALGYSIAELCAVPFIEFVHPDDREATNREMSRQLIGESVIAFENRYRTREGGYRWLRWNAVPDLEHQTVYAIAQDVTVEKDIAALLEGQRAILELVAQNIPLRAIVTSTVAFIESRLPEAACSVLMLEKDGLHVRTLEAPNLPAEFCHAVEQVAFTPTTGTCGVAIHQRRVAVTPDITTDPSWHNYLDLAQRHGLRSCWSSPIVLTDGGVAGTFAMYYREPRTPTDRDLQLIETAARMIALAIERSHAEEALRESERRYRSLVLATPQVVWTADPAGNLTALLSQNTGHDYWENIRGGRWLDYVHPDDRERLLADWQHSLDHHTPYRSDFRILDANGAYIDLRARAIPIFDDAGNVREWVGTSTDVTEAKRARQVEREYAELQQATQAERLKSEKLQALGTLAGGVAHNFNNLLTPILGNAQLAQRKVTDPDVIGQLHSIERAARDGAAIVRRILAFGQVTPSTSYTPCRLVDVITETIHQIVEIPAQAGALAVPIAVRYEVSPEYSPIVQGAEAELREVFANLFRNAVEAMPLGGTISITVQPDRNGAAVIVSDTGPGIRDEDADRIWDPFFSTKGVSNFSEPGKANLGLGLSEVRGILHRHGGTIQLRPTSEGASFQVFLPATQEPPPLPATDVAAPAPDAANRLNILLVDDDPRVRRTVATMLDVLGHGVTEAEDGDQALDLHASAAFDLILTDWKMPRLNGLSLARRLRQRNVTVPIVLMTGWGLEYEDMSTSPSDIGLNQGRPLVDLVLHKPVGFDDLADMLDTVLPSASS